MADSPESAAAKRLLDAAKDRGFTFERITVGEGAPLRGVRKSTGWLDEVYVGGLFSGCSAARRRRYSLVVPGGLPVTERVSGDTLEVLHTVVDGRAEEYSVITLLRGAAAVRCARGVAGVNGSARWALSPLDCQAHLLVRDPPPGVLKPRCGEVLPTVAVPPQRPTPSGRWCVRCVRTSPKSVTRFPAGRWSRPISCPRLLIAPGGQSVPFSRPVSEVNVDERETPQTTVVASRSWWRTAGEATGVADGDGGWRRVGAPVDQGSVRAGLE
ncbi:MAG: hypothetical protein JO281_12595 [Pseudonocardiales bacterium]|nr:hypothetical protein [Pseudonocardiales bacterium]